MKHKHVLKNLDGSDIEFIDIKAFGHEFKELLPGHASNLITLEKEGAIYVKHFDEKNKKFNLYKIKFLPDEIFEYVEAQIAQQEFFENRKKYGDFNKALEKISNKKIIERVKSYKAISKDGKDFTEEFRGNFASFMGPELEELLCFHTNSVRYELLPRINTIDKVAIIMNMFNSISSSINFFSNRKHNRPSFNVENEYDLQDLLYVIAKPIFPDARLEEHTSKHAGKTKRIDMVIPSVNVVVEVKFVRDKTHANSITDEIKIDIESYHVHPSCETLCVLIYDPGKNIIDAENVMTDLSGLRVIGDKRFEIKTLVVT